MTPARLLALCVVLLHLMVLPTRADVALNVQEVRSPNGHKAWLVEEPSIPFVALEIRFRGGAWVAGGRRGRYGCAGFCAGA